MMVNLFSTHDCFQKVFAGPSTSYMEFLVVTTTNIHTNKHHHHTHFAGVLCCCVLPHSNWLLVLFTIRLRISM
jgi:hypothetical protein